MFGSRKNVVLGALLALVFYASSAASSYVLPGILPSGSPNFTHSAQINLFNLGSTFMLVATNAGAPITFNGVGPASVSSSPSHPAYFSLTAQFMANGTYIANTGTLTYSGQIPYPFFNLPGVYISGDLLTVKLGVFAFNNDLLGFSTDMLTGFGTLFGNHESVYFSKAGIGSLLGFSSNSLVATSSPITVSAITTVPVPAAMWLFASGLAWLGFKRRV